MSTNEQVRMLDELQSLLERQIEMARQGQSASEQMASLTEHADSLVQEIARTGPLERAEFAARRKQLHQSYRDLSLAVTAQKDDVAEKFNRVRKGRKTIETYRSNI